MTARFIKLHNYIEIITEEHRIMNSYKLDNYSDLIGATWLATLRKLFLQRQIYLYTVSPDPLSF